MSLRRTPTAVCAAGALVVAGLLAPVALGRPHHPRFTSYASCAHHAPYRAAHSCRWPAGTSFSAAFLFASHVGPRSVRVCYAASGPPPFGGAHGCVNFGRLRSKVYPLRLAEPTRGNYSVTLSWRVPEHGRYRQVAVSRLRITT